MIDLRKRCCSWRMKTLSLFFMLGISFLLTSCSPPSKTVSSPPKQKTTPAVVKNEDKKQSQEFPKPENPPVKKQKVIETPEEFDATDLPLIAAIPEKNIFLYAVKPFGVVLYIQGSGHYFDWGYLTPRFILPRMNVGDFDHDGKQELSVILYIGSGTGVAVEDLHVIRLSEKEEISEGIPNPNYFKDYGYYPVDYLKQINRLVKLKTFYRKGELMADLKVDKRSYVISLKELQTMSDNKVTVDGVCFGNIVKFDSQSNRLTVQFGLAISNSYAVSYFVGDVYADVNYSNGKFSMSNLRFEQFKYE